LKPVPASLLSSPRLFARTKITHVCGGGGVKNIFQCGRNMLPPHLVPISAAMTLAQFQGPSLLAPLWLVRLEPIVPLVHTNRSVTTSWSTKCLVAVSLCICVKCPCQIIG
jgi:hypothetical protein